MKKLLILMIVVFSISLNVKSQSETNIQLHHEFGMSDVDPRGYNLITLENTTLDKYGKSVFSLDMNMDSMIDTTENTYFEIYREFTINESYYIHFEYNGGHKDPKAFLIGVTYLYENDNFNITLTPSYRYNIGLDKPHAYQATSTWNWTTFKGKLSFNGYIDVWQESLIGDIMVFVAEPVLWYNFNNTFSIGSEIEISHNSLRNSDNSLKTDSWVVCPTIALKYTL